MKTTEMKRLLRAAGCYKIDDDGKHEKWYSPITGKRFPIWKHDSKELPSGTEKAIRKQAGLK